MAYMLIFLLKKYSHFFSKNTCELDIVLTRTVNINELVKLTTLWTTGPRCTLEDIASHLMLYYKLITVLLYSNIVLQGQLPSDLEL